jgi:hypothetical protein
MNSLLSQSEEHSNSIAALEMLDTEEFTAFCHGISFLLAGYSEEV